MMKTATQSQTEKTVTAPTMQINAGLTMPGLSTEHRLQAMLNGSAKKQLGDRLALEVDPPLWTAEFFRLTQTDLFSGASDSECKEIVALCSRSLVEEALLIEKCGMAFGVKMSALSETTEERMFYNLMAAEEAIHYHQVRQFVPNKGEDVAPNAFHHLLSRLIENGDRDSLGFVIQVVLEGWGLSHYKTLSDNTLSQKFSIELKEILKDESRHHGTGVILSRERKFSAESVEYTVKILVEFLQMIQLGSQAVLGAVQSVLGELGKEEKILLLDQLDSVKDSAETLQKLRSLMILNGGEDIVSRLDALHCFTPYSAEDCL